MYLSVPICICLLVCLRFRLSVCLSILLLSFLIFALNPIIGQELACTVDIEAAKTQSTDPKVFQNLEAAISEFMNSRKWTDDEFLDHEKISCSILINIDEGTFIELLQHLKMIF